MQGEMNEWLLSVISMITAEMTPKTTSSNHWTLRSSPAPCHPSSLKQALFLLCSLTKNSDFIRKISDSNLLLMRWTKILWLRNLFPFSSPLIIIFKWPTWIKEWAFRTLSLQGPHIFYFKIQVSLVLSKNMVGRHVIKFGGWWWTILIPNLKVQNIKKIIYSANMYSWEKERRERNFFKIKKPVLLSCRLLLQWIFYFIFSSPHLSRVSHTFLLIPT